MIKEYGKKKYNKRIFLITDGNNLCDSSRLKKVISLIESNSIKLNIICIGFFEELDFEEGEINEEDEVGSENEEINEDDEENASNMKENINNHKDLKSKLTSNQIETKKILKRLKEKLTDKVKLFSAEQALSIQNQFKRKKINPTVKYKGPLRITPNLSLDVLVYVKSNAITIPSLKKYSLATEFKPDIKENEIINEKIYCIQDDPDRIPISDDNRMKAYYYGKSLVPFGKEDELSFKCLEDRCFKAIGFTDSYRIPRHHYMSGTDIVIPDPSDVVQVRAFTALVETMILQNKVLICRLVTRAKSEPKLVVLIPHVGSHGAILYLNQLPTIEDIRDYQFDSLQPCSERQEEVMSSFIDNLDLDGNENEEEILKPSETFNPILQYFYQCLEHRALNGNDVDLPEMDEKIEELMTLAKEKQELNPMNNILKKAFPIQKVEKKIDKKKRIYWRDIIQEEVETGISETKAEEKLGKQKDEAPNKISALKPIEDFNEMINYKYADLTDKALDQMKSIILKLINESFKGSFYYKALDCIKVLREKCDEYDETELFNMFLKDLLLKFPKEKYIDLWRLISLSKITLINNIENKKSDVTKEESMLWLMELDKKQVSSNTIEFDEMLDIID